jgi:hypothetical protein
MTLLTFATRSGNASGPGSSFVALDDVGTTTLWFPTFVNNIAVKITYNAECGALGPLGSWVSTTIFVDGIEANPKSGQSFALCSSDGTGANDWKGAVRQSLITVPAMGAHNVRVRVDLNGGATQWWLGDSSIVVEQQSHRR